MNAVNQFLRPLRHAVVGLAFCTMGLATTAQAALQMLPDRGSLPAPTTTVDWSTLGPDFTGVGSSPTFGPVTVTGASAFTVFQQGPTTGTWNGDFADGESVLAMFDANTGEYTNGDFVISLSGPYSGFGLQLGPQLAGAWEIDVSIFDSANQVLAQWNDLSGTSTDLGDGSAFFLGGLSDTANISRIVISGLGAGAAINQITLTNVVAAPVPTPATLALALLALGLLAQRRRYT